MSFELKVYATPDDLPKHLRDHVRDIPGSDILSFHHPFLVDIFPLAMPADIDTVLEVRREHAETRLAQGSVAGYVFSHQRPYRLPTLIQMASTGQIDAGQRAAIRFWRLAASVWMDAEEPETSPLWRLLLAAPIPHRNTMTPSKARRPIRDLPQEVRLYRGLQAPTPEGAIGAATTGFSWSLSPKTATFFAGRHLRGDDMPWIASTIVNRAAFMAHLTRRGEVEIIIDSSTIDPDRIEIAPLDNSRTASSQIVSLQAFFAE